MTAVPVDEQAIDPISSAIGVLRDHLSRPIEARKRKAIVAQLEELVAEPENSEKYRGFDLFWELYPKRDGRKVGKKSTRLKWGHLTLKDKRLAYRGLRNYVIHCEQTGRPPKDPVAFLNQEIWGDFQDKEQPYQPKRPSWLPTHAVPDGQGGWMY